MKANIITVNGHRIGDIFFHNGIEFKVLSFKTRKMVCGENNDVSIKLPNLVVVPIKDVLFI